MAAKRRTPKTPAVKAPVDSTVKNVEEPAVEQADSSAVEAEVTEDVVVEESADTSPAPEDVIAAIEADNNLEPAATAAPETVVNALDDDDELLLRAADNKLEETDSYGIFKQEEGVVSWTITNFIDANGKQYGKRELRANPPVLTLESSTGDKADFVLSKDFAGSLASVIERIHYGYYGLDKKPKQKFTKDTAKQAVFNAIGARPLQVGAFLLLTLVVIVGLIAS